ncbi:MAG: HAD hydrolase-like protein [Burkholderiaceae bacterium]
MSVMLSVGADGPPKHNFDMAHQACLDALIAEEALDAFDDTDVRDIAWHAPHGFAAWPDVREGLAILRRNYIVASFSLLSYRLVIDTSRYNGLIWDAVLSCEGLGVYKLQPAAYERAAGLLQLEPAECLMVACHPFDLDAARRVGYRTALVRRHEEWGGRSAGTAMSARSRHL